MIQRLLAALAVSSLLTSALSSTSWAADEPDAAGVKFFESKIRPVLVKHCYKCHSAGAKKLKGGLVLDTRAGIRKGGESGHAVVPGDLESSLLIDAVRHETFEMPPTYKLPERTIADLVRWVKMGAPDPRDGKVKVRRTKIDFTKGRQFWAFQAPRQVAPPAVKDAGWPRTDVDKFVRHAQEQHGLNPVADAAKPALLRRVTFDLIGLPPSPEEMRAFLEDDSPHAFEKVVDRLLKSPHFGERWGRHWLDVARFAESNGRERNFLYPNAWRYRNYVIEAFNKDKPFDRFLKEQLAGDLLAKEESAKLDRYNELITATGFLAIGPKSLNERNREAFRMDIVDEQIDVSTRAFMALSVSCARCHDHKFDPIPNAEYYALAGIFRSTNTRFGTGGRGNRQASTLIALQLPKDAKKEPAKEPAAPPVNKRLAKLRKQLKVARDELKQLQGGLATGNKKAGKKKKNKKKKPAADAGACGAEDEQPADAKKNRKKGKKKKKGAAAPKKGASADARANRRRANQLRKRIKQLNQQIKRAGRGGAAAPTGPAAMGVSEGSIEDCRIYIRGEIDNRGPTVKRGYLTILSPDKAPKITSNQSGRRELADWLASSENPLTARVLVNRVWGHLFGRGLVRTVDNFGATGARPSHPKLLDYLAVKFVRDGWSVKRLIRSLVLSRTYQLSAAQETAAYAKDPANVWLWRMTPRRLDAESLRDAILAASGGLDRKPPRASVIAGFRDNQALGRGLTLASLNGARPFRSVYLPIVRNAVPEPLKMFDFAEPSILVGQRDVTTVPAQALYFLNSGFLLEETERLADRLLKDTSLDAAGRVQQAYRLALCRPPTPSEQARALKFIERTAERLPSSQDLTARRRLGWAAFCQALFGSAEFRYLQ